MPASLRDRIADALIGTKTANLAATVERLMASYQSGQAPDTPILSSHKDVLAYAAYRMPATYAVARAVLAQLHDVVPDLQPASLMDFGAGTGAIGWAASQTWPELATMTMLEQSADAVTLGQRLAQGAPSQALQGAEWQQWRLSQQLPTGAADIATAAYVLGELAEEHQALLVKTLMDVAPTVVLIEPGTPAGFARIIKARDLLIARGISVLAPCPHELQCPMLERNDWCHFAERLERSRLHRALKGGELSYEDEKYSYVVASRAVTATASGRAHARILRHPSHRKGLVSLQLCAQSGEAVELKVSKSQGGLYKAVRQARWGDPWP
jgi:ribosomal protein RSM22 (predicted rRNA methylase)